MRKNIMILFFSVIGPERNGVITIRPAQYLLETGRQQIGVQTNEAAVYDVVDVLAAAGERLDRIYCFATPAAKDKKQLKIKDGEEICTYESQLDFWQQRIRAQRPALRDTEIIEVHYAYPEDREIYQNQSAFDLVDESRLRVAEMAACVKRDIGTSADWQACHIYADITGGFRHANMMLTAVIQFLQYDGMKLDKVVYSDFQPGRSLNKVFDFKDINDLYKLVSGADAFVKYGSSKAIEEYFAYEQGVFRDESFSEALRELLRAMHQFSDVIQICQTGMVLPALRELARTLAQFESATERSSKEQMFAQLLNTVRDGYQLILPGAEEDESSLRLAVIRWCREKGLLQQAMTLCTEWIPEYLVDEHICYPPDELLPAVQAVEDKLHSSWQKTYIISPLKVLSTINETISESLRNQARSAWTQREYRSLPNQSAAERNILDALCRLPEMLLSLRRRGNSPLTANELTRLFKGRDTERGILQAVYEQAKNKNEQTFGQFLLSNSWPMVQGKLINKKDGRLLLTLCGARLYRVKDSREWSEKEKMQQTWEQIFAMGAATTCVEQGKVYRCLQEYSYLRQRRNQINHANADHVISRQAVVELIDTCLQSLYDAREDT